MAVYDQVNGSTPQPRPAPRARQPKEKKVAKSKGASGKGGVNPFATQGGGRTTTGKSASSKNVQAKPGMRQGQGTPRGKK